MKVYRGNRCLICGKLRDDKLHQPVPKVSLLYRLLHLAWPRWRVPKGEHDFKTDRMFREASADADRLMKKMKRHRR
ncbi:MAG TPA: hypothetical protein VIU40_04560 [Geobacteraceae bacterium]